MQKWSRLIFPSLSTFLCFIWYIFHVYNLSVIQNEKLCDYQNNNEKTLISSVVSWEEFARKYL